MTFISRINVNSNVYEWLEKICWRKQRKWFEKLINEENLNQEETRKFIDNRRLESGQVETLGTDIEKILPPMRRFGGNSEHEEKKAKNNWKNQEILWKIFRYN